jgi:hypothetical protein
MFLKGVLLMNVYADSLPFVKQQTLINSWITVTTTTIHISSKTLQNEKSILEEMLSERQVGCSPQGFPIRLELGSPELKVPASMYRERIVQQGYSLKINRDTALIQSSSPAGIFYGVQTLAQLLDNKQRLPRVEILDWPDLAVRMIMVDPARQNEKMDYY